MAMVDRDGPEKLLKELRTRVHNRDVTLNDTLIALLNANRISKPDKMAREDLESYTNDILSFVDYGNHLPQRFALTAPFVTDVMDPVVTVPVPTARYRVTMRKLLRLNIAQLQQQAELMKVDFVHKNEEGLAAEIMINMKEDTPLIRPLIVMLLSKEIAFLYGIRFEVPIRGPAHPSSTISFVVKPTDIMRSSLVTKNDLLDECENQGLPVTRRENKRQLAIRLIVWWTANPERIREPFTPRFASYLLESARKA